VTFLVAFLAHSPTHDSPNELLMSLLLLAPGLISWARGQFQPWAGSNPARTLSGALMGVGLGRTLYLHCLSPWPVSLTVQGAVIAGVAIPALLLRKKVRALLDPPEPSSVSTEDGEQKSGVR
jgi:hypothetical protein